MQYTVMVKPADEGYAVWCPGLPGCWSQGQTEQEALENIKDAISEYLLAVEQVAARESGATVRTVILKENVA